MAAPATTDEFLDLVRRSGVLEERRLDAYMDKLRAAGPLPTEPGKMAGVMVAHGQLTHFQAEQLVLGKWRRFHIGKYKVLERLGSGGMGSVYLCEHKLMRRRVAVKVLPTAKADDPSSLDRFYREARAVAALDHPNIVRAYDIDQDEKLHFLVMEYVDGASLQEMIKRAGPMDLTRACHYIAHASLGLQHAHDAAGLVHRDIKPGNILVDRTGAVKVLDMGLARFFNDEEDVITKKYDENVLGTADYLAPEQALDSHTVDIRADIYSLGATFYYCLSGQPPFKDGTVAQKLIWHQTRQPKPIRSLRPDVPDDLAAILDRMMAKDPDQRFQTPHEVADALSRWTQNPIGLPPEEEMPRLSPAALGLQPSMDAAPSGLAPVPVGAAPAPSSTRRGVPPVTSTQPLRPLAGPRTATASSAPVLSSPGRPPLRAAAPAPAPILDLQPTPSPTPNGALPTQEVETAPPSWEEMVHESPATAPVKQAATKRTPAASERSIQLPSLPDGRRRWLVLGAVGVGVAGMIGLGGWMFLGRGPDPAPPPPPPRVTKHEVNSSADFLVALGKAKAGDTIQIRCREIVAATRWKVSGSDTVTTIPRDLTIEASGEVLWRAPDGASAETRLLELANCEGLRLKGPFVFDGGGRLKYLILVRGHSAGLVLEGFKLRNYKEAGIWVQNAEGIAEKPIALKNLNFLSSGVAQTGLRVQFYPNLMPPHVRDLALTECMFEGPFKIANNQPYEFVGGKPPAIAEWKINRFQEDANKAAKELTAPK